MINKPELEPGAEFVIPVIEEQLEIEKRPAETARIQVRKTVVEEHKPIDELITSEEYDITRIPVNRVLDAPLQPRQDGDTLILPVMQEEVIVQRRLVLVEEVHVTRKREQHREQRDVLVRREQVDIDRTGPAKRG